MPRPFRTARTIQGSVIRGHSPDPLDRGLIFEARFGRNTGLMVPNTSGHGGILTATNTPDWVGTNMGLGLQCVNASLEYLSGVMPQLPQGAAPFTDEIFFTGWSTWTGPSSHIAFGARAANQSNGVIHQGGSHVDHYFYGDDLRCTPGPVNYFLDGLPHHIVATYDGINRWIYVDGGKYTANDAPGAKNVTGTTLYIGATAAPGNYANLVFLLVRIYDRTLAQPEAAARYQIARKRMQTFGGEWEPRYFALAAESPSISPSASLSPSASESPSVSPSASLSPSPSISPSASESPSNQRCIMSSSLVAVRPPSDDATEF